MGASPHPLALPWLGLPFPCTPAVLRWREHTLQKHTHPAGSQSFRPSPSLFLSLTSPRPALYCPPVSPEDIGRNGSLTLANRGRQDGTWILTFIMGPHVNPPWQDRKSNGESLSLAALACLSRRHFTPLPSSFLYGLFLLVCVCVCVCAHASVMAYSWSQFSPTRRCQKLNSDCPVW